MTWASVLTTISNGTLYALACLGGWGSGLLRVVVWPLLRLVYTILLSLLLPWQLLGRFEAMLSFIVTAVLAGAILGLAIHLITTRTIDALYRWVESIWNPASRRRGGGSRGRRLLEAVKGAPSYSPSHSVSSDEDIMEWYDRQDQSPQNDGTIVEEEEESS
ncbi:uncharacterized protein BO80DRAFT_423662 [Aspergillus ibericus CBS 121593]|uniref:Uncharacterized protein n=1 Tax=Aspergillus ibericus CBS 121593 TaxID=1448316 RepID=A0A395H7A6_9EURO|nr:hypothetical protein BO80DRAFT_423662 [Aspergillus ibericus CBS 121593]RAL02758.1 hypothetical protein BO80DRAFT_423662 [Aspergillus ibericus CBS 121593]